MKVRSRSSIESPPRGISIDFSCCNGCGDCVAACLAQLHDRPAETGAHPVSRVKAIGKGPLYWLAICRQCEEAPCADACITGALRDNEMLGTVEIDEETCIGCGMCVMACPFGSIWLDLEKGKAVKCDTCAHLETPPCVAACKPAALSVDPTYQLARNRRRRTARSLLTPDKRG